MRGNFDPIMPLTFIYKQREREEKKEKEQQQEQ